MSGKRTLIKSGSGAELLEVERYGKSIRTIPYISNGLLLPHNTPSYGGFIQTGFGPNYSNASADIFMIGGSASKTIAVTQMSIWSTGYNFINSWNMRVAKRSTLTTVTGGTGAIVSSGAPYDSNDAAYTANLFGDAGNGSVVVFGTLVGYLYEIYTRMRSGTTGFYNPNLTVNFMELYGRPVFLRGANEMLSWYINTIEHPTPNFMYGSFQWMEF